jgi:hypothetical protein
MDLTQQSIIFCAKKHIQPLGSPKPHRRQDRDASFFQPSAEPEPVLMIFQLGEKDHTSH